jgi:CubicO group peptidase (beta-lactamase class C family)
MNAQFKVKRLLILVTLVPLIFILSSTVYPQNMSQGNNTVPDSLIKSIVTNFIKALNSGDREAMQDFIVQSYDKNVLKRIPISSVVSLNMAFYYETGGLGFELKNLLPSEGNLVSAELLNKLTESNVKLLIPVSAAPDFKINWFIKADPIPKIMSANQVEKLSDNKIVERTKVALNKMDDDEEFSGTVLIAKNGTILLEEAVGEANKSYKVLNNVDTKFNMASVGKMFTGLAIIQLAEKKKLSFDDYLGKYIPADWLNPEISNKIQIKHLLTHTSGLGDYFRDAYQQCVIQVFRDLDDYKSLIVDDSLTFEPGAKFSYSNTGMLLLGLVIEKITGEEYFNYLQQNIFEPAGMVNTGGFYKDRPVENRATGYTKIYENGIAAWNNHQFTRVMRGSPSGGVYSTIKDLLKFDIALRSNKLLSKEYSKFLFEGRPELNASIHSYAFFMSNGEAGHVASHQGDGQGVNCQFKMYLDSGYTVVVLSNYSRPSADVVGNVIDQLINTNSLQND